MFLRWFFRIFFTDELFFFIIKFSCRPNLLDMLALIVLITKLSYNLMNSLAAKRSVAVVGKNQDILFERRSGNT
jgi:hypothetical protein